MPGHDAAVELQDLGLQGPQLTAESNKAHAGQFRELVVVCIGDDFQQMLNTPAPDRGDDPELGKIGADRVDDGRLLADEQMACTMKTAMPGSPAGYGYHWWAVPALARRPQQRCLLGERRLWPVHLTLSNVCRSFVPIVGFLWNVANTCGLWTARISVAGGHRCD